MCVYCRVYYEVFTNTDKMEELLIDFVKKKKKRKK